MNHFKKMAYPYVAWISIMVVAPMLMIIMYAFIQQSNDVTTFRFTLSNFTRFFSDRVYTAVLYRSLYVAVITTVICLLIGYPAAYIIAMAKPRHKAPCTYDNVSNMDKYACANLCLAWHTPG